MPPQARIRPWDTLWRDLLILARGLAGDFALSIAYRTAGSGLGADNQTLAFSCAEYPEVAVSFLMHCNTTAHGRRTADRLFTTPIGDSRYGPKRLRG